MIRARRHIGLLAAALLALAGAAQAKSACQLLQVAELQVTMLGNLPTCCCWPIPAIPAA